jgi:mannose-1-phosphate guanylyltransferase/mannose-6-phosphate isomerase
MPTIVPVLLAGGEGRRLQPLSSASRPKQFLRLIKNIDDTLFQASAKRALMVADAENIITIAGENYKDLVHQQLSQIDNNLNKNVILEPCGRNTTAAITAAAIHAASHFSNPILWIIPTDHMIEGESSLLQAIKKSALNAWHGKIVLFGIKPTREDSNYGYIIAGDKLEGENHFSVKLFIEKPSGAPLQWAMAQKHCWWNSGMFLLSAETLFLEMKKKDLATLKAVSGAYTNGKNTQFGITLDEGNYAFIKANPIDKVIMEKSKRLVVYPVDINWSDVGSWQSLWELTCHESGDENILDNFLTKIARVA